MITLIKCNLCWASLTLKKSAETTQLPWLQANTLTQQQRKKQIRNWTLLQNS